MKNCTEVPSTASMNNELHKRAKIKNKQRAEKNSNDKAQEKDAELK